MAPRTLSPPGTQGPGRPAPPGSRLATHRPVGWGHHPWCSPRSPQPRWVYVCLFIRFHRNSDLFHIWFGNFQPQKSKKKIERLGCPCPDPLRLWGVRVPDPRLGPTHPCGRAARVSRKGTGGQAGTGLPTCVWSPRVRGPQAVGRWALGTGLSRGGLQAQRFWNASGQGVLMGVRGQGLCWFEAGKLTVKFHCCLREGAHAVPSAPIHMPRGRPPIQSQVAPRHGPRPPTPALLPALYLPFPPTPARQV